MRTVYVDGQEVLVDDRMQGPEIRTVTKPSTDQFPVIIRNENGINKRMPVNINSRQAYELRDNDRLENMYRVPNGRE
jgi:hypothetical protein